MDINSEINVSTLRNPKIVIGEQDQSAWASLIREALSFAMDIQSTSINNAVIDGDEKEIRQHLIYRRRVQLLVLEMLENVHHNTGLTSTTGVLVKINDQLLTIDMVNVVRQALMHYKFHKVRVSDHVKKFEEIINSLSQQAVPA